MRCHRRLPFGETALPHAQFSPSLFCCEAMKPLANWGIHMAQLLRITRPGKDPAAGPNTTTYELTRYGTWMTSLAALGSFGSFVVNFLRWIGVGH